MRRRSRRRSTRSNNPICRIVHKNGFEKSSASILSTNKPHHPPDPASARLAQDVDTPKAHDREVKGTYHWGRGGEGNMMTVGGGTKVTETEGAAARPSSALRTASRDLSAEQRQGTRRSGSFHAAVEKGKELLGLGSKKEREAQQAASENAIE
ncbi:uncharacterized protein K489DRAFT_378964 [Dissoconium aciculare CBS 342.82]|uniref:Uncharacterized protein n=1 Tax=Dissoconium aciculare CBS 342.82 TaxID=1314786 RepID=A0A6J3M917_9PEZI|nr:uncharacterized protein K489DRAFT_378964 [Dissoconium aciculare CBS 342.82]KAF1824541.1 hypothetical protein K489DRAFT_378964 [Dissoconium aciculare CBS 342.82]